MNDISIYTNAINRLFIPRIKKTHMFSHEKPPLFHAHIYIKPKHIYHTSIQTIDNTNGEKKKKIKSASL